MRVDNGGATQMKSSQGLFALQAAVSILRRVCEGNSDVAVPALRHDPNFVQFLVALLSLLSEQASHADALHTYVSVLSLPNSAVFVLQQPLYADLVAQYTMVRHHSSARQLRQMSREVYMRLVNRVRADSVAVLMHVSWSCLPEPQLVRSSLHDSSPSDAQGSHEWELRHELTSAIADGLVPARWVPRKVLSSLVAAAGAPDVLLGLLGEDVTLSHDKFRACTGAVHVFAALLLCEAWSGRDALLRRIGAKLLHAVSRLLLAQLSFPAQSPLPHTHTHTHTTPAMGGGGGEGEGESEGSEGGKTDMGPLDTRRHTGTHRHTDTLRHADGNVHASHAAVISAFFKSLGVLMGVLCLYHSTSSGRGGESKASKERKEQHTQLRDALAATMEQARAHVFALQQQEQSETSTLKDLQDKARWALWAVEKTESELKKALEKQDSEMLDARDDAAPTPEQFARAESSSAALADLHLNLAAHRAYAASTEEAAHIAREAALLADLPTQIAARKEQQRAQNDALKHSLFDAKNEAERAVAAEEEDGNGFGRGGQLGRGAVMGGLCEWLLERGVRRCGVLVASCVGFVGREEMPPVAVTMVLRFVQMFSCSEEGRQMIIDTVASPGFEILRNQQRQMQHLQQRHTSQNREKQLEMFKLLFSACGLPAELTEIHSAACSTARQQDMELAKDILLANGQRINLTEMAMEDAERAEALLRAAKLLSAARLGTVTRHAEGSVLQLEFAALLPMALTVEKKGQLRGELARLLSLDPLLLRGAVPAYAALHEHDEQITKLMQNCYDHTQRQAQVLRSDILISSITYMPDRKVLRVALRFDQASTVSAASGAEVREVIAYGIERACALRVRAAALVSDGTLAAALLRRGFEARVSVQRTSHPSQQVTYFKKSRAAVLKDFRPPPATFKPHTGTHAHAHTMEGAVHLFGVSVPSWKHAINVSPLAEYPLPGITVEEVWDNDSLQWLHPCSVCENRT